MSTVRVKIEKGIPVPPERHIVGPRETGLLLPWKYMEVGDSFFVEGAASNELSPRATTAGHRNRMKFTCRNVPNGCRVWRIE